jgi:asparagine synthetase B (glutamine-hydrolysing)
MRRVYFGRDFFGRRSLLYRDLPGFDGRRELHLSSIAIPGEVWKELDTRGIYHFDLMTSGGHVITPWNTISPDFYGCFAHLNTIIPNPIDLEQREEQIDLALGELDRLLDRAVRLQVTGSPVGSGLGILFSGGIDSMVMAVLADRHFIAEERIDLLNVAFARSVSGNESDEEIFGVPDRLSAREGIEELR